MFFPANTPGVIVTVPLSAAEAIGAVSTQFIVTEVDGDIATCVNRSGMVLSQPVDALHSTGCRAYGPIPAIPE